MNNAFLVVKVIRNPVHMTDKEYEMIEIKVEFPGVRQKNSNNEITLILWGNYKNDFLKYYKVNDYLLIEGIVTLKKYGEAKIIVRRLYPFLLHD